ncbi:hypothetical protein NHH88_19695 [Oxalobacteraceae bacterium OTU3CAMAD1]|nr:hypothetical protein NHH88_19695 [Oxalobacteraceae bacterium OTU3CAMAD1]
MADLYYFKKITQSQWLGLRLPRDLRLDVGDDGAVKVAAPWRFEPLSPLPGWAGQARVLTLCDADGSAEPGLAWMAAGDAAWQPFRGSRTVLGALPASDEIAALGDAMEQASLSPVLPLRLYQAYRDYQGDASAPAYDDERVLLTLMQAVGGTAANQPVEAYAELLFIVDSAAGPGPAPGPEIDAGAGPVGQLRLVASQAESGVVLQLGHGARTLTNGGIVAAINAGAGQPGSTFAPFYRWYRTLGVAERRSGESGAVLIPAEAPRPAAGASADFAAWADRPFSLADRLGPRQLIGELLNYEVKLFNAHGRCTHSGRVMLKRQRLGPVAPPLRARAELLAPADNGSTAICTVAFDIAADEAEPGTLKAVLYRQDYPVVPTGFYGDDDDGALVVARSLNQAGDGGLAGGVQFLNDVEAGGEQMPNLSNHNLVEVDAYPIAPAPAAARTDRETGGADGPDWQISMPLKLESGRATQLFLALRRDAVGVSAVPESPVALAQHVTGLTLDNLLMVPHFERFWGAPPAAEWLGEGRARVMEVEGDPAKPAAVRVVVQHANADNQTLIGGYRLWLRDVAAPGDDTPFEAVAMVQAVPRLVKVYAPIEGGRQWAFARPDAGAGPGAAFDPAPPDAPPAGYTPLSAPAAPAEPKTDQRTSAASAAKALQQAMDAPGDAPLLLQAVRKLQRADCAREVLLSVATRRAMERALRPPPGNWLFFRDQNGNLLGRALQFWLPAGVAPHAALRSVYQLAEPPSAQDTVALDDFGRVAWTWNGLADLWRHELEWLVEAVPRYAPINRQRAALGPDANGEAMAVRQAAPALWHRLVVQRRLPFNAHFALSQVLDAKDDAFVIALDAPREFRQALHNTVARTRQGVLRMHPSPATTRFLYGDAYDGATPELLGAWLGEPPPAPPPDDKPEAPTMTFGDARQDQAGIYGELLYDEPPCMELSVEVGASADDMHAASPAGIKSLRRHGVAVGPAFNRLPIKRSEQNNTLHVDIPLARLGWSYSGDGGGRIGPHIPAAALEGFRDRALLDLPDPEAELVLLFEFDKLARPVARFRGSALKGSDFDTQAGLPAFQQIAWGTVSAWDKLTPSLAGGHLRLSMAMDINAREPQRIIACWRRQGMAFPHITQESIA